MIVLGAAGCIEEYSSEADYYVRNETEETLHVEATALFGEGPVMLANDVVPPGETVYIHHVIDGSGGDTVPSNFFESFTVSAGDLVVYDGVVNDDWTYEIDPTGYVLTIAP